MELVLIRIDDRLLHAQVSVGCVSVLSPDVILIADDELASQSAHVQLLRMGLPPGVELIVAEVQKATDILKRDHSDRRRCILLVRSPLQALELVDADVSVAAINIGGMHAGEGKSRLLPYLYVDRQDIETLRRLASRQVRLVAQDVPGNPSHDVVRLIAKSKIEQD